MKRRSPETPGDSDLQQISKRSNSLSSEEVEVEERLLEERYSEGLDSEELDSEHQFNRDARAIIPRINSGDEEIQISTKATRRVVFVTSPPSPATTIKS